MVGWLVEYKDATAREKKIELKGESDWRWRRHRNKKATGWKKINKNLQKKYEKRRKIRKKHHPSLFQSF